MTQKSSDFRAAPKRHVVLVQPEVHWNTGNIGRTCLGTGATLHLVRPLGFSIDDRQVRRAGLDYWKDVPLKVWENFDAFEAAMAPADGEVACFSKTASQPHWQMQRAPRLFLVFGSETGGLPSSVLTRFADYAYHIPITGKIRSLNLSTAVGIALYESLRHTPPQHGWPVL